MANQSVYIQKINIQLYNYQATDVGRQVYRNKTYAYQYANSSFSTMR